jgi:hypothetical protein
VLNGAISKALALAFVQEMSFSRPNTQSDLIIAAGCPADETAAEIETVIDRKAKVFIGGIGVSVLAAAPDSAAFHTDVATDPAERQYQGALYTGALAARSAGDAAVGKPTVTTVIEITAATLLCMTSPHYWLSQGADNSKLNTDNLH